MNINKLKNKLKSIALLEAIISPEWEDRYFSYDSDWAEDEEMASMRDGEGNSWFLVFRGESFCYKSISQEDGLIENYENIKKKCPKNLTIL